jgi:hypothetical protein
MIGPRTAFALATNVCATDVPRIRHTVKSWLRTFGNSLEQISITVDPQPPSGRIAALHSCSDTLSTLRDELDALMAYDSRIVTEEFSLGAAARSAAKRWFKRGMPIRCQAGTPILAFIVSIEAAESEFVLRADCDMLFHDAGWLADGIAKLRDNAADLIEPPRLGGIRGQRDISTRALLLSPSRFSRRCLPIVAHKLDWPRRIHRRLHGRPTWLALEQMLTIEMQSGRIRHEILPDSGGFSLHVPTREDAALPWFSEVVEAVEDGKTPDKQIGAGWNFTRAAWHRQFQLEAEAAGVGRMK